ncbi:MAG: hypothetical protein ACK452_08865, partial [Bacteroidota bacterium]
NGTPVTEEPPYIYLSNIKNSGGFLVTGCYVQCIFLVIYSIYLIFSCTELLNFFSIAAVCPLCVGY